MRLYNPRPCPRCGQSVRTKAADIIAAVAAGTHPLTTIEVALKLRARAEIISTSLTKLANLGLIKREYRSGTHNGGGYRYAIWSPLPTSPDQFRGIGGGV